jgi:hypothetical protein
MTRANPNAWDLLGVARDSDPESVARAYRRLARAHHPDVSGDPDAAQRFGRIAEAYQLVREQAHAEATDPLPNEAEPTAPTPDGSPRARPSAVRVRHHQASAPSSFVEDEPAPEELSRWLWAPAWGQAGPRPPIVAGPVQVTPSRRASTDPRREGDR